MSDGTSGHAPLPLWVKLRRSPGVLPTSGVGGKADEIRAKADIARNPFTAAISKISNFGGAHRPWDPFGGARGEAGFFSEVQGRTRTPGRYRFHLPVGQPLASDCRSTSMWDPYLGLMRFRPLGPRGRATARAAPRPDHAARTIVHGAQWRLRLSARRVGLGPAARATTDRAAAPRSGPASHRLAPRS